MSFVFALAYPEGLVLPLLTLAALCALRDRWLMAAVCAAAATLARPEGLFLVVPLAAIAVRRWPTASESLRARSLAAVLAPAAALASFSAYLWWTVGDPLAWSKAERTWGRSFSLRGLGDAFAQLVAAPKDHDSWIYRDLVFCVLYVVLLIVAWRGGLPRSWIAAGAATVLLPIASGSFTSDARFGLLAPAIFWGLAIAGRRRALDRTLIALCPLLLVSGASDPSPSLAVSRLRMGVRWLAPLVVGTVLAALIAAAALALETTLSGPTTADALALRVVAELQQIRSITQRRAPLLAPERARKLWLPRRPRQR